MNITNAAVWMPPIQFGDSKADTLEWMTDAKNAVVMNCADPLLVSVFNAGLQLQPVAFTVPPPVLASVSRHVTEEIKAVMDKVTIEKYSKDVSGLEGAKQRAYTLLMSAVTKGGASEVMLQLNRDWRENKDGSSPNKGHHSYVRAVKAIIETHITDRPGNDSDNDRAIEISRKKVKREFDELQFVGTLSDFQLSWNTCMKRMKDEGCTELNDVQLMIEYVSRVQGSDVFGAVAAKWVEGSLQYPESVDAAYRKLASHQMLTAAIPFGMRVSNSHKPPIPGYVLAVHLEKDPRADDDKQKREKAGRDRRASADDKESELQKDGTTWYRRDVWNSMSREEKRQHHRDSEDIRKKSSNTKDEEKSTKKAALMVNQVANGEFSDEELVLDSEYMYGGGSTALMVTKREKAQDQYDTYMSQYDIFMSKCDTKTQQGLKSSDAGRMLLRDSTAPTMSITSEQFEDAIAAAADAAARRALDAMTAQDAVSNRGAQSAQIRGASQHLYDSIEDAITEEKEELPTVAEPVVPTRFTTWLLLISMFATAILVQWWRLTVTSSDEGCIGSE